MINLWEQDNNLQVFAQKSEVPPSSLSGVSPESCQQSSGKTGTDKLDLISSHLDLWINCKHAYFTCAKASCDY